MAVTSREHSEPTTTVSSGPTKAATASEMCIRDRFWALFYNALGIPLAAGVFYPLLGWQLSPMFGAAAMSLSSLCVVGNALRLRT